MRLVAAPPQREPLLGAVAILAALALMMLAVVGGHPAIDGALVLLLAVVAAVAYKVLLRWDALITSLILIILFIPIRRYVVPGDLPFQLEPYRILVALIVVAWITSALIDRRVRLRRSTFDAPLMLIVFVTVASVAVNGPRVAALGLHVAKALTFFASFVLVFYLIVSVVRTHSRAEFILKGLVGGGAILGVLAVIESRTSYNVFDHLTSVLPLLKPAEAESLDRQGAFRAIGSAQHPIALSALLALLVPFGVYLAYVCRQKFWWFATGALAAGVIATVSRTGTMMLAVIALGFLWLRPRETRRLIPFLLPLLVVVHFALPASLGTLKQSFFPAGGLISEQKKRTAPEEGNRIADIAPTLKELHRHDALLGVGYATRLVQWENGKPPNARILDDQWLGTALETGYAGFAAWLWLFLMVIRRLARRARDDFSRAGWFYACSAVAVLAFAIGMTTYDAFAFIQVTFIFYILLGLTAALLSRETAHHAPEGAPAMGNF